jgi:uncharacterized protein YjbJ (UPF0337 family)
MEEHSMATGKEHEIEGKLDQVKGAIKEGFGALIGDRRTEAEGKIDRAKGAIQEGYGKVKSEVTSDDPTRDL